MSFKIYSYTPAVQSAINSTIEIADQNGIIGNTGLRNTVIGVNSQASNGFNNCSFGNFALASNDTGYQNSAFGFVSLANNSTGRNNTSVGVASLLNNVIGNNNTGIGNFSLIDNNGNNNTVIGYQQPLGGPPVITTRENIIAIGYNSENLITADNEVRIGNAGITKATTQVAWTAPSDERLKSDIKDLDIGLDFVTQIRPVSYFKNNDPEKKLEFGIIAQELENALKNNNISNSGIINEDGEGFLGVRYNDFIAILIKSTQELRSIAEKQQKEIEELENIIKNHQESIDKLNSNLS
jgi:hypothetical protein